MVISVLCNHQYTGNHHVVFGVRSLLMVEKVLLMGNDLTAASIVFSIKCSETS